MDSRIHELTEKEKKISSAIIREIEQGKFGLSNTMPAAINQSTEDLKHYGTSLLTNEMLRNDKSHGGRSIDTESVLLALQNGSVGYEEAAKHLSRVPPSELLRVAERNIAENHPDIGSYTEVRASEQLGDRHVLRRSPVIEYWEDKIENGYYPVIDADRKQARQTNADDVAFQIRSNSGSTAGLASHVLGRIIGAVLPSLTASQGSPIIRHPKVTLPSDFAQKRESWEADRNSIAVEQLTKALENHTNMLASGDTGGIERATQAVKSQVARSLDGITEYEIYSNDGFMGAIRRWEENLPAGTETRDQHVQNSIDAIHSAVRGQSAQKNRLGN